MKITSLTDLVSFRKDLGLKLREQIESVLGKKTKPRRISVYGIPTRTTLSSRSLHGNFSLIWVEDIRTYIKENDRDVMSQIVEVATNSGRQYRLHNLRALKEAGCVKFRGIWYAQDLINPDTGKPRHVADFSNEVYNHANPVTWFGFKSGSVKTPAPVKTNLYLGMEIELEGDTYDIYSFKGLAEDMENVEICSATDGSLNEGVEFKTQPLTLKAMLSKLAQLDTALSKYKFYADDNCGIHVHVGRNAIPPEVVERIDKFLQYNREQVISFADRESDEYASFDAERYDRYRALNLTNSKTIEFRIFASSREYHRWVMIAEWVHAVCMMCKQDKDYTNYNHLIAYVQANPDKYQTLLTTKPFIMETTKCA